MPLYNHSGFPLTTHSTKDKQRSQPSFPSLIPPGPVECDFCATTQFCSRAIDAQKLSYKNNLNLAERVWKLCLPYSPFPCHLIPFPNSAPFFIQTIHTTAEPTMSSTINDNSPSIAAEKCRMGIGLACSRCRRRRLECSGNSGQGSEGRCRQCRDAGTELGDLCHLNGMYLFVINTPFPA